MFDNRSFSAGDITITGSENVIIGNENNIQNTDYDVRLSKELRGIKNDIKKLSIEQQESMEEYNELIKCLKSKDVKSSYRLLESLKRKLGITSDIVTISTFLSSLIGG